MNANGEVIYSSRRCDMLISIRIAHQPTNQATNQLDRVSRALPIDDAGSALLVLLPRHPQLVEATQRAYDRASQPRTQSPVSSRVPDGSLSGSHRIDLQAVPIKPTRI